MPLTTPKHQIDAEWLAIREYIRTNDPAKFGAGFNIYLLAQMRDNWQLFSATDVAGMRRILTDFIRCIEEG